MEKNQKIACITGVTGQDGSFLAKQLLDKGYKVIGIKRRVSHLGSHERIEPYYTNSNFELIYGNMHDASSIFSIINKYKPDLFFHLAAQSHVRTSFEVTEETFETITLSTLRILNAIKDFSPNTRFYHASSSEMFGVAPMSEKGYNESSTMIPASPYAISKLAAHHLVRNYRESYGLHVSSGILFNHESPLRGETFVTKKISMAVARIKFGLQDKLYLGNLKSKRDWGYAPEFTNGMILMLEQDKADDYVLATGEMKTVEEYLENTFDLAHLAVKKHVEIDKRLYRPEEVPILKGDYSKAKEKLNWSPKVKFDELVKIMYEYEYFQLKKEYGQ